MKKDLHPTYHTKTKVNCSCGNEFDFGGTMESLTVEVCSACHPYYTGKHKLVDVAGRIDKFKKRLEESEKIDAPADKKKKATGSKKKDSDGVVKLG